MLSVDIRRSPRLPLSRLIALSVSVLCATLPLLPAQAASATALAPPVVSAPGFDTCAAPSVPTMAAWHASSAYRAIGIYVGGTNRACGPGNLTAGWVHAVTRQGWSLVPIYVGLQAPCAKEKGMSVMSAAKATRQGTEAADDAASSAASFDLAEGSPLYFDLEAFDENNAGCVATVTAFLKAWTARLHARGYLSGVYGSADSGMSTLAGIVLSQADFPPPDAIWIAHWDRRAKTGDESVPDYMWVNHQRIKQYQGGHRESHGGVSLDIDSDWLDGPVARISG